MYVLENLTWMQAKEAFAKCKTAIIPWGSTEQHGRHLPIGTDWFVAEFMMEELKKSDYPAIITPVLPIGYADYHCDFPGSLSFSYDTVRAMATDICNRLIPYGITHILFFNCHGGNAAPLNSVCYELRKKGIVAGLFMWFELAGKLNEKWAALGHADALETSVIMAHKPGLVDTSAAKRPVHNDFAGMKMPDVNLLLYKGVMPVHLTLRVQDISACGSILEPHLCPGADKGQWIEDSSPETAKEARKAVIEHVVGFLAEFEKLSFKALPSPTLS